jgi:hypothetical protein
MEYWKQRNLSDIELNADTVEGATIYGPNNEKIGSISHFHGSEVVLDVGGFLGLGAKSIAVPVGQLEFLRDEDGNVHAVTNWTKDQLKAMPEHSEPL